MVAGYRCLCRGLSSRRELSQRPILPAPACLAYILLFLVQCSVEIQCRGNVEAIVYTLACLCNAWKRRKSHAANSGITDDSGINYAARRLRPYGREGGG